MNQKMEANVTPEESLASQEKDREIESELLLQWIETSQKRTKKRKKKTETRGRTKENHLPNTVIYNS
jgi:hypothetical protein